MKRSNYSVLYTLIWNNVMVKISYFLYKKMFLVTKLNLQFKIIMLLITSHLLIESSNKNDE